MCEICVGQALPPPSTQVGPVVLSWLALSLPSVRYKILPARLLGGDNGIKLSLLGFLVVKTVQNSPCIQKKRQIEPFRASRESFVPEVGPCGSCWESFVPHMRCEGCAGRVLYRSGAAWFLLGEICFAVAPSVCAVAGFPTPTGAPAWPSAPAARSTLVAVGVLRHAKPSGGVSPACRTLAWRNSPRLVAARPWFAVVWRSNRRPIGRKSLKTGCFG